MHIELGAAQVKDFEQAPLRVDQKVEMILTDPTDACY